jgi:hypothetical protein
MNLNKIISEIQFTMYQTMVYVEFTDTTDITTMANLIRSLDMVSVVNNRSDKEDLEPRGYLLVKIITTKPGKESFAYLRSIAIKKIPELKKFNYSPEHIEKVKVM